jgi:hypothetical protein
MIECGPMEGTRGVNKDRRWRIEGATIERTLRGQLESAVQRTCQGPYDNLYSTYECLEGSNASRALSVDTCI